MMLKERILFYPFNRRLADIDLVTTVLRIPDPQREECHCAHPSLTHRFQEPRQQSPAYMP